MYPILCILNFYIKMSKYSLGIFALLSLCVSSCHFGDTAEDMVNKYNNIERDMVFTLSADQPGGTDTRVAITDNELDGITSIWEKNNESIAVFDFGEVFTMTNGSSNPKNALCLAYEEDVTPDDHGIDYASFKSTGRTRAKMGETAVNAKNFALMYPYGKFSALPCNATSVKMDYNGQTGRLNEKGVKNIEKNYFYAWGYALGTCNSSEKSNKSVVDLIEGQSGCSSNLPWHSHGGEKIILDNKMAIIRFSLIANEYNTLSTYLGNDKIDYIDIENIEEGVPGFSEATVDLRSGLVTATTEAQKVLRVTPVTIDNKQFKEITKANATPSYVGGPGVAWGTTFYLAVPCPKNKVLPFHPVLTIHTTGGKVYYGSLQSKDIKEGDYYMTAPIKVTKDEIDLDDQAQIYLYYHSSYVWSGNNTIDVY